MLVRAAFRMSWSRTLVGAWLVLRANQKWAPFPDNDPDAARALMTRFGSARCLWRCEQVWSRSLHWGGQALGWLPFFEAGVV